MKKEIKLIYDACFRYLVLIIIGLFVAFSQFFYYLFLPLTIYPVNFLLNLFYKSLGSIVSSPHLLIGSFAIEIIPACVAVSAFYLLLILNLSTAMSLKKRIYTLLFSFLALLLLNILRIFLLTILLVNQTTSFDLVHKFLWYGLSIFFVIAIWFLTVFLFKIKNIPIYSDIKFLFKEIKQA